MNDIKDFDAARYYAEAQNWGGDRERQRRLMMKVAWTIAGLATLVAVAEALALASLVPLKTVVPYTLLVDRQTGNVEALRPLDKGLVAPDAALVRSFLAQYVIAREGFSIESLRQDYRKVALWSGGEARAQYIEDMQASNPASPLAAIPRQSLIEVQVRSISSLGPNSSMVRFVKTQIDPGGRRMAAQSWSAVIKYRFSAAEMSEADRLVDPLGFQVIRYRRDAELPVVIEPAAGISLGTVTSPAPIPMSQ